MSNATGGIGLPLRWIAASTLCCALLAPAAAQWAWRDQNGRTVFSDVPPPATVKSGDVLQQPARPMTGDASSAETETGTSGATPAAPAPRPASAPSAAPSTAEQEQQFRKRQKDREEAEKKETQEQANAQQKSEACERARGYLRSLEDNMRVVRAQADGTPELLDQDQRNAEQQRTQEFIGANCN